MKTKIYKKCCYKLCDISVHYFPRDVKSGRKRYCCLEHMKLGMLKNENLICIVCSNGFYCSPSQQEYRKRKTCSIPCRSRLQTLRAQDRNKNNPPTIGVLNRRIRYSKAMKDWRKAVFERDNYTCQICFIKGVYIEADHIKQFAFYPELRYELSNGRTLCRQCHRGTDTWGKRTI